MIQYTLTFPLYLAYYHYVHSLLPTPINDRLQNTFTKVKKENPQLGSNADHNSTTVWQYYRYANWLVASRDYWYLCMCHSYCSIILNPSVQEKCMQVGLMVIPIKLESESLPLCILDLRHNKSKAQQNKKNKKILNHDHLIGRTKIWDSSILFSSSFIL